jgi:hypothetical protein
MFVGKERLFHSPIITILNGGSPFVISTEAARACPEQGRRAERRGLLSPLRDASRQKQISPPFGYAQGKLISAHS